MQLVKQLSIAATTLISATTGVAQAEWQVDFSTLFYGERDAQQQDRVKIIEPVLSLTKQNAPDDFFNVKLVYDTLSGASPNGGFASSKTQTFTSPSGGGGYVVKPGYTPLDPTFKDERTAVSVSWMTPINRFLRYQAGVNYSSESDYTSLSGSYSLLKDVNQKQTTLTAGIAYSYDAINPHGGFPTQLASLKNENRYSVRALTFTRASGGGSNSTSNNGGSTSSSSSHEEHEGVETEENGFNLSLFDGKIKQTVDLLFGVSHVLNRYTLLNVNYGISYVSGYQTDPYKLVPIYDSNGYPVDYVHEKRPESRFKQTLKLDAVTAIGSDSLHLSYRYFMDDWGVKAHTYDFRYHLSLGHSFYLEPHYRYSQQSKADFYRLGILNTSSTPRYASSDIRLADMTTVTLGGMIGWRVTEMMTLTLNAEEMTQSGDSHPKEAIGDMKNYDMFPTIKATLFTVGVRMKF